MAPLKSNPFDEETQRHPIIIKLNKAMDQEDVFWQAGTDRFVSSEALQKNADVIEVVMTREQFMSIATW